jgi:hypothetical protein
MTGFNHTLAGCIAAVVLPAPVAPFVAFISHFFLDAMPHFNFGRNDPLAPFSKNFKRLVVADAVLCFASLGFSIWLFPHLWWLLIICSFTSTLPDFLWPFDGRVRWLKGFLYFSKVIQWAERSYGWIYDLMYGLIFTLILFNLS